MCRVVVEKKNTPPLLIGRLGKILDEIRETRELILILPLTLYGSQVPQLCARQKIECYMIPKVSFSTKGL